MGSFPSKLKEDKEIEQKKELQELEEAHLKALEIVKKRTKDYDYSLHGSKDVYMLQVYNEFKLECIPLHLRNLVKK